MAESHREETYHIEDHVFVKRYVDGGVTFLCDECELSIEEWNRELNRVQPMRLLEEHPNPLVRMKEAHRRQAFVGMMRGLGGAVVADIGCEEGHLAEMIAPKCAKLFCVDIDEGMLENARRRLMGSHNIEYTQSDVRKINLPDNSLDVCVAAEVLEHLPRPEEGLDELARITKPGGRIYISVPNEVLLQVLKRTVARIGMGKSLGKLSGGLAVGHVQVFSKKKVRDMCEGKIRLDTVKYSAPFFLNIFASGVPIK